MISDRANMGRGDQSLDWGMGEHRPCLAGGSAVRITGQTPAVALSPTATPLHDQNRERWDAGSYVPLQNVSEGQPRSP